MRTLIAICTIFLFFSVANAKDVQLLDTDIFGKPTSTPIKLLYDKKPNEIEPSMITADIKSGTYYAASVYYGLLEEKVTFAETRASINKIYKRYENLSLFQESQFALWRVVDKGFVIQLSQEKDGGIKVIYLQFDQQKKE